MCSASFRESTVCLLACLITVASSHRIGCWLVQTCSTTADFTFLVGTLVLINSHLMSPATRCVIYNTKVPMTLLEGVGLRFDVE